MLLPALAANVALARQALAGLTDDLGVDVGRAAELRAAIAEAWTRALDHGDCAHSGPLEVQMAVDRRHLVLRVEHATLEPPDGIVLALTPGGHAAAVLGRVVSLVAARADFSIDRLSDAQIVSDAIAGNAAAQAPDGIVRVRIDEHAGGFELVVGPLVRGGGARLLTDMELPGLGCLLTRLTDRLDVKRSAGDDADLLHARLDGHRRLRPVPSA